MAARHRRFLTPPKASRKEKGARRHHASIGRAPYIDSPSIEPRDDACRNPSDDGQLGQGSILGSGDLLSVVGSETGPVSMTALQPSKSVALQALDHPNSEPVSIRQVLIRLWTYRRLLAGSTLVAGIIAAAVSLALPNQYTARATILPDAQTSVSATGLSQLAASFGFAVGRAGNGLTDLYPTMLTSERILAPVLYQRLPTRTGDLESLVHFWGLDKMDSARAYDRALRRFHEKTLTVAADRRTLVVSLDIKLRDPLLAANVANAIVAQMDSFVRQFQRGLASDRVRWIETRLTQVLADLERSETTLKDFPRAEPLNRRLTTVATTRAAICTGSRDELGRLCRAQAPAGNRED